ncbi:hypothetical protein [Amycolatopsis sp. WQ 127309]|uniref:hypothetical protein n=1 Tax=Amycolatopsis sp. WQ 127309 TaxID=2932773 RepID=UPI001FF42779|nr:hypothetical protein [Amycolatopsis sp. WQ 127309]UOZ05571.1 hypothetical protein MUY22_43210 [Amycolatopsis sp. WQ 127309]
MSTTTPDEPEFDLHGVDRGTRRARRRAVVDAERGWDNVSSALTTKREAAGVDAIAVAFNYRRLQQRLANQLATGSSEYTKSEDRLMLKANTKSFTSSS